MFREVGPKSIFLVVIDGGADWGASEEMIQRKYPWVHFLHCGAHQASLIIKDICKIDEVAKLLEWMTMTQKWFSTNRLGPLLKKFCEEHYGCSKAFVWPAETRFGGRLLQMKRFFSMKAALQQCVQSAEYLRFDFEEDDIAPKISGSELWILIHRIVKAAGPILLLMRLADMKSATLSKMKGTVDYIDKCMDTIQSEANTLEDNICVAWRTRLPELQSDIATAAWVIDPQFVAKSRGADSDVMESFWSVCRKVLRIADDADWKTKRSQLVTELAAFRMKTGGFTAENYGVIDTCAFWTVAGCHAPGLRQIAMYLAPLPCSSGEAERNWWEMKQAKTKIRNRLSSTKLSKLVFVRRFIRLKRAVCNNESNGLFKDWTDQLLKQIAGETSTSSSGDDRESTSSTSAFKDHIESGEQARINGCEAGELPVSLTDLKKDHSSRSWLFEKYYQINFVDKNPEGEADDPPLEDESEWEHRVIKNIVWWRRRGYAVETCLRGPVSEQSIVNYQINSALHDMIRASPRNVRPMLSTADAFDSDSDSDEE